MKSRLLAALAAMALWCGSAHGQAQNFPGGSGGASSGGIPTVTRGLLLDCNLTETSGTTLANGTSCSGTLGATNAAPVFPSISGFGTALAMDNFTNAALTTAGNWTAQSGTIATSGGIASVSVVGGDGTTSAFYTGLPTLPQNQFCEYTIQGTPGVGGTLSCTVRHSSTAETYYACDQTSATLRIFRRVAGAFFSITTQARVPSAGDQVILQVQENSAFNSANLTCTVIPVGGGANVTITGTDNGIWTGVPGIAGGAVAGTNTISNWRAGVLDTNIQGGLLFGGGQFVTLPASLNSALTIEVYGCFQVTSNTNTIQALVSGNGNGAASNANGLVLNAIATADTMAGLPHLMGLGGAAVQDLNASLPNGCADSAITFGNSSANLVFDRIYMNGLETTSYGQNARNASAGLQTVGAYQLGGAAAGSGFASATFYTGTIYRVRFFSVVLTPSEILQDHNALVAYMSGRGVTTAVYNNQINDVCVATGDSQTAGSGLTTPTAQAWTQLTTFFNPANSSTFANGGHCYNQAVGGSSVGTSLGGLTVPPLQAIPDQLADPLFTASGNRNVDVIWLGTNDLFFAGSTQASILLDQTFNYVKARSRYGWKTINADVISRGASGTCTTDTAIQAYNPLIRQSWPTFTDGFVDLASFVPFSPNGGAGHCTNTTYYNADNIHPSIYGHALIAYFFQHEVNALFGNKDWSSANTYTVTATAATATTAGTSTAAQIGTITMAATQPYAAGQCVVVAGVTPAGWNTPSGDCYLVLTSSSTQITVTLPSNPGTISVQGTVSAPQELDQDVYAILGGSATTPSHTLETCQGRTGHTIYRMFTNTASNWVITPFTSGETINGGATYTGPTTPAATNHPVVALKSISTSNTAGGCTWQASLQ